MALQGRAAAAVVAIAAAMALVGANARAAAAAAPPQPQAQPAGQIIPGSGPTPAQAQGTAPARSAEPITERHDTLDTALTSPAEDLNLRKTAIPDVLVRAVAAPYDLRGLDRCAGLRDEIARIDAAVGPDRDLPPAKDTRSLADKSGGAAVGLVRTGVEMVTPYRGIIRRITGATAYEKKLQEAVEAGFARRGFLKGLGVKMNCPPPAAPAGFKPAAARVPPAPQPAARRPAAPARPAARPLHGPA